MNRHNNKPYEEIKYLESDGKAKQVALIELKEIFEDLGITIMENNESFGIDILGIKNGNVVVGIEVEHKKGWRSIDKDRFSFPTIHISERKRRHFVNGQNNILVMCNEDFTYYLVLEADHIGTMEMIRKDTKTKTLDTTLEPFIEVPAKHATISKVINAKTFEALEAVDEQIKNEKRRRTENTY